MDDNEKIFDELQSRVQAAGAGEMLAHLTDQLRATGAYHELFDARLLEARHRLGLSAVASGSLDDLPEPQRTQMEEAYLEACREVGGLLMREGRVREGWMYLRPVGERDAVAKQLEALEPTDEQVDEVIDIAVHEGAHPRLGFELVLRRYGTCNAITLFDSQMYAQPLRAQQEVARLLVAHIHDELLKNVCADIERREGQRPTSQVIGDLVASRPALLEGCNYHVDVTHLASVLRIALVCDDRATLERVADMCAYGARLDPQFQFAGPEPFAETYQAYGWFFRGQLGDDIDAAVDYFRARADAQADADTQQPAAEVLVALLARVGRDAEAFDEAARRLSIRRRGVGLAPSTLELAVRGERLDRLIEVSREQGDVLSFATGLLAGAGQGATKPAASRR